MPPDYFEIKNWRKHQHYRDRNPPWIKLHVEILSSQDWVMLSDASKLLAVVCMVIAAKADGKVPNNPTYIKRVAYLDHEPKLNDLIRCGFLVNPLAHDSESKQTLADARPETEAYSTDTERYPLKGEVVLEAEVRANKQEVSKPETLAVDAYNAIAQQIGIPPCQRLSTARRAKLAKRLSDCGGVTGWEAALAKLRASDFCAGKNDRGWKADFDFMLQEKSFTRLLEGFYDNRTKTNGKPSGQDIAAAHYAGLANALGFGKMGTDGTGPGDEGSTIDGDFEVIGADGPGQPPRLCPSDERPHPIRPSLRDTVPRPGDGASDLSRATRQAAG
jgi:hypothetical protein